MTKTRPRGTVSLIGVKELTMHRRVPRLAATFAISAVVFAWITNGRAASLLELNFGLSGPRYDAVVPLCDAPGLLGPLSKIQGRFATKESRFWNSNLQIVAFENVREVAFRPWASGTIPRRFCTATVLVSNGIKRPIHYSIGEDTGMIGAIYGVEWCVVGLDRNWAYNPACRMARP